MGTAFVSANTAGLKAHRGARYVVADVDRRAVKRHSRLRFCLAGLVWPSLRCESDKQIGGFGGKIKSIGHIAFTGTIPGR